MFKSINENIKLPIKDSSVATPKKNLIKIIAASSKSKEDSVAITLNNPLDTTFTYSKSGGFDGGDYVNWLKNMYPKINDDCARYLSFKVSNEIRWRDSINAKTKTATTPTSSAKVLKKSKLIKSGSLSIVSTRSISMTAHYTGKKANYDQQFVIPLRVY